MGFTKNDKGITYREWAPAAQQAYLFGDFNGWCVAACACEGKGGHVLLLDLARNARSDRASGAVAACGPSQPRDFLGLFAAA